MRISVISVALDNLSELFESLNSIRLSLRYALGQSLALEIQLIVVVPEGEGSKRVADWLEAFDRQNDNSPISTELRKDGGTGISAAFNLGLSHAQGDSIAFLNAGDLWFERTLSVAAAAILAAPERIIHSAITYETDTLRRYEIEPDPRRLHQRMTVFHPTLFVPKKVFATVGGFDETYFLAMDSHWCHRACALKVEFSKAPVSLALMRLGGRSDQQYVAALAEFRRSVVSSGLTPRWNARWNYWRVLTAKRVTHLPFIRRCLAALRSY